MTKAFGSGEKSEKKRGVAPPAMAEPRETSERTLEEAECDSVFFKAARSDGEQGQPRRGSEPREVEVFIVSGGMRQRGKD